MDTIKIWNDNPSELQLRDAIEALRIGEIIIIPTDTIYALACDALNVKAIDSLCRLKGINPEKSELSIICDGISMASEYTRIDNSAYGIIKPNVPGPFTFLLPASRKLPRAFRGRKTVGVRIPECATSRAVAEQLGNPLMVTTIKFDDHDYGRNPELIAENYEGRVAMMIEGEEGDIVPSTIVDLSDGEPEVVREGKGILKF